MRRAARDVGREQRQHHAEHRGADAAHALRGDRQPRHLAAPPAAGPRSGNAAQPSSSTGRRPSAAALRPTAGRAQRHDPLRHHDAGRDDHVGEVARTHRYGGADQRQHRGVGQMEQQHADGEISRRRSVNSRRSPGQSNGWIVVCRLRMRAAADLPAGPAARARTMRPSARTPRGWTDRRQSRPSPPRRDRCRARQIARCVPAARQAPRGRPDAG